ncbi:MAG: hypothetical protein IPP91_04885 [Betaproteobacteria bacterium]|nr:hypothetical protein [Betaproteobacteria bacterium]
MADVELVEATEQDIAASADKPTAHVESDSFWDSRYFDDGAARFSWKDHFEFFVSGDGSRVLWRRLIPVHDEVLLTYLLNQVLAQCLVVRGIEPLHATCVVVNGQAIAIMGDTGYGKSTLAAALMRRGHPLLTDDLLVLEFAHEGVRAFPSLPRLKLCPDSADAAFDRRRALPMNVFTDKMILPLEGSEHVAHPVMLGEVFVIPSDAGAESISIVRATGHDALLPLIRNSFDATFLHARRLEQQFDFACRLAACVPISIISYPRQLERLPEVAGALLASLSKDSGSR